MKPSADVRVVARISVVLNQAPQHYTDNSVVWEIGSGRVEYVHYNDDIIEDFSKERELNINNVNLTADQQAQLDEILEDRNNLEEFA